MKDIIYNHENIVGGKIFEITIFIIGILALIFRFIILGSFLSFVILFDWILSFSLEKVKFGDSLYSWKVLFNKKMKGGNKNV